MGSLTQLSALAPGINVLQAGLIPNNPAAASSNTAALIALVSPIANGGNGLFTGNVYFPLGQTWYINNFIAVKPGIHIDLGFGTIMFNRVAQAGDYGAGVFTGLNNFSIKRGTINVNYTGAIPANAGDCIRIGSRAAESSLFPGPIYDAALATPQGNIELSDLTLTSNVATGNAIGAWGGLRNVRIDRVSVQGQGVMLSGFQYEWGYATPGAVGVRTYSHAFNIRISNLYVNNMNLATGMGVGFYGAYNCHVEGLYVNTCGSVILCGSGEAANYLPWAGVDDVGIKRGMHFKNIVGEAIALQGISFSGITEWTGELAPIASQAQEFDIIGLAEYELDTFVIAGNGSGNSGISVDANKAIFRNGRLSGFGSAIFDDGCLNLTVENVDLLNNSVAGINFTVGDAYVAGRTDRIANVKNSTIANNGTAGTGYGIVIGPGQVNITIDNVNFGLNNRATATLTVTGGTNNPGVNRITNITINGVDCLVTPVDWTTSNAATAALIAAQINSTISAPDYTAVSYGATIVIRALLGTGTAPNGFVVTPTVAGNFAVGGVKNMSGGALETNQLNSVSVSAGLANVTVRNSNTLAVAPGGIAFVNNAAAANGNFLLNNIGVTSATGGWFLGAQGTATNDTPVAGSVGEVIDSSVISQTVTTAAGNLTSIVLTPGDWDVAAVVETEFGGVNTYIQLGISQVSATFTGNKGRDYIFAPANTSAAIIAGAIPHVRISLAATTTVYLVALTASANINAAVNGYLSARRMR